MARNRSLTRAALQAHAEGMTITEPRRYSRLGERGSGRGHFSKSPFSLRAIYANGCVFGVRALYSRYGDTAWGLILARPFDVVDHQHFD
jgi:hypothetical protein